MSKRTLAVLAMGAGVLAVHLLTGAGGSGDATVQAGAATVPGPTATSVAATAPAGRLAPATTPAPAATPVTAGAGTTAPVTTATTAARSTAATPTPATPTAATRAAAAAPSTTTAPAVLELGTSHPWVTLSQRRLNSLGFGDLEVDGRYGPATVAAVVLFEQANGTSADGRLEPPERLLLLSHQAQAFEDAPVVAAVPQPVPVKPSPPQPPAKLTPPTTAPPAAGLATAATARTNANCQGIEAEFLRQGAEAPVADQFAYVIAPRESGCVAQQVSTATDLSYSRLGLNFIGSMPTYWNNLCGVTDYRATAELSVDVRCGLAAYRALGWKPWGG